MGIRKIPRIFYIDFESQMLTVFCFSLGGSTTGIAILQGSKTSDMRKKIREICSNFDKPDDTESETYIEKVDIINKCLEDTDVNITNLIEDLGNDVAALGSVPDRN